MRKHQEGKNMKKYYKSCQELTQQEINEIVKKGGDALVKLNNEVAEYLDNLNLSEHARDVITSTDIAIMADCFGGLYTSEEVESFVAEYYGSTEALELSAKIRKNPEWNLDDCRELCDMAGIIEEWEQADGETFESVVYKAADILDVSIY